MGKIIYSFCKNGKRYDRPQSEIEKAIEVEKGGPGSGRYPKGSGGGKGGSSDKDLKEELRELHLDLNDAKRRGKIGLANDIQYRIDGLSKGGPGSGRYPKGSGDSASVHKPEAGSVGDTTGGASEEVWNRAKKEGKSVLTEDKNGYWVSKNKESIGRNVSESEAIRLVRAGKVIDAAYTGVKETEKVPGAFYKPISPVSTGHGKLWSQATDYTHLTDKAKINYKEGRKKGMGHEEALDYASGMEQHPSEKLSKGGPGSGRRPEGGSGKDKENIPLFPPGLPLKDRIRLSAWDKYKKVQRLAWAEYEKKIQPARAEYDKKEQSAWAEYNKIKQSYKHSYEKLSKGGPGSGRRPEGGSKPTEHLKIPNKVTRSVAREIGSKFKLKPKTKLFRTERDSKNRRMMSDYQFGRD